MTIIQDRRHAKSTRSAIVVSVIANYVLPPLYSRPRPNRQVSNTLLPLMCFSFAHTTRPQSEVVFFCCGILFSMQNLSTKRVSAFGGSHVSYTTINTSTHIVVMLPFNSASTKLACTFYRLTVGEKVIELWPFAPYEG